MKSKASPPIQEHLQRWLELDRDGDLRQCHHEKRESCVSWHEEAALAA
jgi:hypothetical protein